MMKMKKKKKMVKITEMKKKMEKITGTRKKTRINLTQKVLSKRNLEKEVNRMTTKKERKKKRINLIQKVLSKRNLEKEVNRKKRGTEKRIKKKKKTAVRKKKAKNKKRDQAQNKMDRMKKIAGITMEQQKIQKSRTRNKGLVKGKAEQFTLCKRFPSLKYPPYAQFVFPL